MSTLTASYLARIVAASTCLVTLAGTSARAEEVIKLGTMAAKASPIGKSLTTWAESVKKKAATVDVQLVFGGEQGDEVEMVGKVKHGQLDCALVTTAGLSKIYKPILALELPGLFTTWAKLDKARDAMRTELDKGAHDAGFAVLGWLDLGMTHIMSKAYSVKVPDDLKGKKPMLPKLEDAWVLAYQVIGGVNPVPLSESEVLPSLNKNAIDIVIASAYEAEQMQWSSKLDNLQEPPINPTIGALVCSSKRLDALATDARTVVTDTAKIEAAALSKKLLSEDDAAFGRLKGKMTVTSLGADDKGKWAAIWKDTWKLATQSLFPQDEMTKLEGLAK